MEEWESVDLFLLSQRYGQLVLCTRSPCLSTVPAAHRVSPLVDCLDCGSTLPVVVACTYTRSSCPRVGVPSCRLSIYKNQMNSMLSLITHHSSFTSWFVVVLFSLRCLLVPLQKFKRIPVHDELWTVSSVEWRDTTTSERKAQSIKHP